MRDLSFNLPYWARLEGYTLEGGGGTYDNLYLWKGPRLVKVWHWYDEVPSIFELEEFLNEIEDKEVE
jgi:hypothetical protein